jgi:hypothetical protein
MNFGWIWIEKGSLSKLLGTPFGLSVASKDIDQFLLDKVKKKLTY